VSLRSLSLCNGCLNCEDEDADIEDSFATWAEMAAVLSSVASEAVATAVAVGVVVAVAAAAVATAAKVFDGLVGSIFLTAPVVALAPAINCVICPIVLVS
jgi:hypothetical protein